MKFEDKYFNLLETSYHKTMSTINELYEKGIPLTDSLMKSEKEVTDAIDEALSPYYKAKEFLKKGFANFKFRKREKYEDEEEYREEMMKFEESKMEEFEEEAEIYQTIVDSWEQDGELVTEEDIKEYEAEVNWTDKDWREHYGFDEDDDNPDWDSVTDDRDD